MIQKNLLLVLLIKSTMSSSSEHGKPEASTFKALGHGYAMLPTGPFCRLLQLLTE